MDKAGHIPCKFDPGAFRVGVEVGREEGVGVRVAHVGENLVGGALFQESPQVHTGLRLVMGSWKTMEMRSPRMARICLRVSFRRSRPWKWTDPSTMSALSDLRRMTADIRVDLPQPLSPTTPTNPDTRRSGGLLIWT
jgi:hypothetical protein